MFENKKIAFDKIGIIEGWSFLTLLFIAMPLKYVLGIGIATKIVGMIHGGLWIWFLYALYEFQKEYQWGAKFSLFSFLMSIIPFGTFYLHKKLKD